MKTTTILIPCNADENGKIMPDWELSARLLAEGQSRLDADSNASVGRENLSSKRWRISRRGWRRQALLMARLPDAPDTATNPDASAGPDGEITEWAIRELHRVPEQDQAARCFEASCER